MFKNYLTHSFVVRFHQTCLMLDIPRHIKIRLTRSAEQLLEKMNQAVQTDDPKREAAFLCAALLCLRDCRDIIDQNGLQRSTEAPTLIADSELLAQRLEDLCVKAAKADGGQLRMLA